MDKSTNRAIYYPGAGDNPSAIPDCVFACNICCDIDLKRHMFFAIGDYIYCVFASDNPADYNYHGNYIGPLPEVTIKIVQDPPNILTDDTENNLFYEHLEIL